MPVIDCQAHLHCRSYFEAHVKKNTWPRAEKTRDGYVFHTSEENSNLIPSHYYEIEEQMDYLLSSGVDVVVSSMGAFNVDHLPLSQATELALHLNEERSDLERRYPGQYYALAILPMQDPSSALQVLQHAVKILGLRGVCIGSNVNGDTIASQSHHPVYREIAKLGVPLFLHPTRTVMESRIRRYGHEYTVGFMVDTSFAALDLIFSGTLEEFPHLNVVHPHAGGVLPYLTGRIEEEHSKEWSRTERLTRPVEESLKRFYTDTVTASPRTLEFAIETYGIDQMLFSSDYPYWSPADGLKLTCSTVPEEDLEKVLYGNAAALLDLPRWDSSSTDPAAVAQVNLTGDEAGGVQSEEQHRSGDFRDPADSADRDPSLDF